MEKEIENMKTATLEEHQKALYQLLTEFDSICRKYSIRYTLFAGTMLGAVRHQGFIPWDDDLDVMMLRSDYNRFMKLAEKDLDSDIYFLQKEFSEHWPCFFSKLRLNNTTCLEKYHPKDPKIHQGIYIDIFPCDNAADSQFIRKLQFLSSKIVIAKALYRRGYETDSSKKKLFMNVCRVLPDNPFVKLVQLKNKEGSKYVHSFFGASSNYHKSIYKRRVFENVEDRRFEKGKFPVSTYYDELLTTLYGDYMILPAEEERKCKKHAILVDLNHSWKEYEHYRDNMMFDEYTRSIR